MPTLVIMSVFSFPQWPAWSMMHLTVRVKFYCDVCLLEYRVRNTVILQIMNSSQSGRVRSSNVFLDSNENNGNENEPGAKLETTN